MKSGFAPTGTEEQTGNGSPAGPPHRGDGLRRLRQGLMTRDERLPPVPWTPLAQLALFRRGAEALQKGGPAPLPK